MAYIRLVNGSPQRYTLGQLRRDNPAVSFPDQLSEAVLAEYDMHPLSFQDMPVAEVVERGPIELINGVWTQTYTGRDKTPEEKKAGMVVTARQARLALQANDLLASVDGAINAMQEPEQSIARIEWEYATEIERKSSWVAVLGAALGLTDDALDALFEVAATL